MQAKITNLLFLCTQNSARSIMAECILNELGAGRFRAYSAGSHPAGRVNPNALDLLEGLGHPTDSLASKSWDVFVEAGAPEMDVVITVCDRAAGATCPFWPGRPAGAPWPIPDPAAVEGSAAERAVAFAAVYKAIAARVEALVALPVGTLDDPEALGRRLAGIGARRP